MTPWLRPALVATLVASALVACDNRLEARVGGAVLPQAFGTVPLTPGATTVAVKRGVAPSLPAGAVQLAFDVDVPWSQARPLIDVTPRPGLVVGDDARLRGFVLDDELDNVVTLRVLARADGKFCIDPPGTDELYCLQSADRRHISAAFVREVMRKAVAEYGRHQAWVIADPELRWADLIRTVDGVRTCCDARLKVAVAR